MKFTSEDLIKAMGLQVGDRVKVKGRIYVIDNLYALICMDDKSKEAEFDTLNITILVRDEINFEILSRPKRVGDLICDIQIKCNKCPLKILCNSDYIDIMYVDTLYNILELFKKNENFDQEIYNLLKARLDKEVFDNA